MKALAISVVLFSLLILGIIANTLYIRHIQREFSFFLEQVDDLPVRETALCQAERLWARHRRWMKLTVGFRELNDFEEALILLRWAYDRQNEAELEKYRLLLLDHLKEITEAEQLSLGNLF